MKESGKNIAFKEQRQEFRDECLNLHWFMSVGHARAISEDYRIDYNNDLTPAEFMRLEEIKEGGIL